MVVDWRLLDLLLKPLRNNKIVNTPASVVGTGVVHITPPGVGTGCVGIKTAECVNEAVL